MTYKFKKNEQLSGTETSIYTIVTTNNIDLFQHFLKENAHFDSEIRDIVGRLRTIGHKTGAREEFFKLKEGKLGDGVCALYDTPSKKLRLYCIRNNRLNIVLGGGGEKPKGVRSFQEIPKLEAENYFLRAVSQLFYQRLKDKDIRYSKNDMDLEGDLEFDDEDLEIYGSY